MKPGTTLTDAARGVYSSPQAAHRALERARIVASDAIHEIGLKPQMWMKELAKVAGIPLPGVGDPQECGKKEVHVRASLVQNEKIVKLYDPHAKIKACAALDKTYYAKNEDRDSAGHQSHRHSIRICVGDTAAAEGFAKLFAARGTTSIVVDVGEGLDTNLG